MYEENSDPLAEGDFLSVFADEIAGIVASHPSRHGAPQGAADGSLASRRSIQRRIAALCRRLLLPGSRLQGFEHLAELAGLSSAGNACLLCMNHISNLDVPTLRALAEDQADASVFDRIVWISGRKLHEDCGLTPMLAESFQQIVVTPRSWLRAARTAEERSNACRMNMRAYRTMRRLRKKGWIIGLFPAGTRRRSDDERTAQAVEETDSYLKYADYVVLGRVEGCTLPVTRDRDMSRETPCRDRVVYAFGPVCRTSEWRARAASRYPALTQRAASAQAIMEDIEEIAQDLPSADPVVDAGSNLRLPAPQDSLSESSAPRGAS